MKNIIVAWLVGEGLMIYKDVKNNGRPPLPAELLATSGLFLALGILGEKAPELASLVAWGFDLAAFLTLWGGTSSTSSSTSSSKKTTTTKKGG